MGHFFPKKKSPEIKRKQHRWQQGHITVHPNKPIQQNLQPPSVMIGCFLHPFQQGKPLYVLYYSSHNHGSKAPENRPGPQKGSSSSHWFSGDTPSKTNMTMETTTMNEDVMFLSKMVIFQRSVLVGGFNPFEKYYCSQIGSFPQVGVSIKKCLKPPPTVSLLGGFHSLLVSGRGTVVSFRWINQGTSSCWNKTRVTWLNLVILGIPIW